MLRVKDLRELINFLLTIRYHYNIIAVAVTADVPALSTARKGRDFPAFFISCSMKILQQKSPLARAFWGASGPW